MSISAKVIMKADKVYNARLKQEIVSARNNFSFYHGKLFGLEGYDFRQKISEVRAASDSLFELATCNIYGQTEERKAFDTILKLQAAEPLYFQLGYAEGLMVRNSLMSGKEKSDISQTVKAERERLKWFIMVLESTNNSAAGKKDLRDFYNEAVLAEPKLFCSEATCSPKLKGIKDAVLLFDKLEKNLIGKDCQLVHICRDNEERARQ